MNTVYFGSGPATLPLAVREGMATACLDYNHSGNSILSIPHRGKAFAAILAEAKERVLRLCNLEEQEYDVLWMQGGGRQQFAMIPMNFLDADAVAGYIDSGHWAHDALEAAKYYGRPQVLSSSSPNNYTQLPDWPSVLPPNLAYLYCCSNNTIYGTQMQVIPKSSVPLIVDMSSDIFSCERDYSRCDLFFAVAQKNIGMAGVTLVVLKKEMQQRRVRELPGILSYAAHAQANSLLNTAPVPAIYSCLLTLRWIEEKGPQNLYAANKRKAAKLYAALENNSCFQTIVSPTSRSEMNVVFRMKQASQEAEFLEFCTARKLEGIAGHRSVGGFRVSLYNAISEEDVALLISAIQDFGQTQY